MLKAKTTKTKNMNQTTVVMNVHQILMILFASLVKKMTMWEITTVSVN